MSAPSTVEDRQHDGSSCSKSASKMRPEALFLPDRSVPSNAVAHAGPLCGQHLPMSSRVFDPSDRHVPRDLPQEPHPDKAGVPLAEFFLLPAGERQPWFVPVGGYDPLSQTYDFHGVEPYGCDPGGGSGTISASSTATMCSTGGCNDKEDQNDDADQIDIADD